MELNILLVFCGAVVFLVALVAFLNILRNDLVFDIRTAVADHDFWNGTRHYDQLPSYSEMLTLKYWHLRTPEQWIIWAIQNRKSGKSTVWQKIFTKHN